MSAHRKKFFEYFSSCHNIIYSSSFHFVCFILMRTQSSTIGFKFYTIFLAFIVPAWFPVWKRSLKAKMCSLSWSLLFTLLLSWNIVSICAFVKKEKNSSVNWQSIQYNPKMVVYDKFNKVMHTTKQCRYQFR